LVNIILESVRARETKDGFLGCKRVGFRPRDFKEGCQGRANGLLSLRCQLFEALSTVRTFFEALS